MSNINLPTSDVDWAAIYKELDDIAVAMSEVLQKSFLGTTWRARSNNTLDRIVLFSSEWIGGGPLVFVRFEVYFAPTRHKEILYSRYHTDHYAEYQNERLHHTLEEAINMVIREKFLAPLDYISISTLESYVENRKNN